MVLRRLKPADLTIQTTVQSFKNAHLDGNTMITYYKRGVKDKTLKKITNHQNNCWIHIVDPTDTQIAHLAKTHGLEEDNLREGLDDYEIPRVDKDAQDNTYVYINSTTPHPNTTVQTMLIVLTKNSIITLSKAEPLFMRKILEGTEPFITQHRQQCLITILDLNATNLEKESIKIVKAVKSHKVIRTDVRNNDLLTLLEEEDQLNTYVTAYYYMALLQERLLTRIKFTAENAEAMEDLIIECRQGFNVCKSALKTIQNLRRYYDSLVNNRLNQTLKILTIFTIFLTIPSMISGIYGMNVTLPFQNAHYIFYGIIVLILLLWVGFTIYLRMERVI